MGEIPDPGRKQIKLLKENFSPFSIFFAANRDFLAIKTFFFSLLETNFFFFSKNNFGRSDCFNHGS